jgi:hypothetical protein
VPVESELSRILAHAMECDICLSVIVDLSLPTDALVDACPEYRALWDAEQARIGPRRGAREARFKLSA